MNPLLLCLAVIISSVYITSVQTNSIATQALLIQKEETIKRAEELKSEAKVVVEELRKQDKTQLATAIEEAAGFVENLEMQVRNTNPVNEASIATLTRLLEVLILAEIKLDEELKKALK